MRITFLNQKGGVGKSTVSILIGAALNSAGYSVAFDDQDTQGSVRYWAEHVGHIPLLGDVETPDVIVCDTPGRLDLQGNGADGISRLISESDRLIIVSEKSLFSIQASIRMVELIKKHQKPIAKAAVLFNKVRMGTLVGQQDPQELADALGIPCLINSLPLAAPFENIQQAGFSAVSSKHRELVLTLALEILK